MYHNLFHIPWHHFESLSLALSVPVAKTDYVRDIWFRNKPTLLSIFSCLNIDMFSCLLSVSGFHSFSLTASVNLWTGYTIRLVDRRYAPGSWSSLNYTWTSSWEASATSTLWWSKFAFAAYPDTFLLFFCKGETSVAKSEIIISIALW